MILSEGVGRFVGDRYHIVRELGRGGMGVVYLGRDLRREMDVAIKFRGITHHDATLWLKREFRSVASLRHPNLVELYELVAHEQSCYFTMEYLPGVDPRRWVARPRALPDDSSDQPTHAAVPLQEAHTAVSVAPVVSGVIDTVDVPDVDFSKLRSVLAQLAEGLAFLHARGVIHRDVKPSNVIVGDGTVKLLDFGLALERRRAEIELARETRVVGTVAYLAPEYLERLDISPAMDVYALGVLAFELVTGAPPFGGTLHVLSRLKRKMELPRARSINPEVPEDLDELIDQMLASEPLRRPSAMQVAVRLSGSLSYPRQIRRATQFVGREAELARIDARIADPAPRGRLVLVTGPSGVGKTALIEEAVGRARVHEPADDEGAMLVWRGKCHERERVPYRAFDFI
ncbi:MAG: serine/threonine-protein kinase PknK, partial [Kofleriaceae bacterium]|nr:serine/threonine-protein kinase PknK [Kofleriaceae bacterium]